MVSPPSTTISCPVVRRARRVAEAHETPPPERSNRVLSTGGTRLVRVVQAGDIGALPGQRDADGGADAPGGAGHHRQPAGEIER